MVLHCEEVKKSYTEGPQRVEVLKGVDFAVQEGQRVAIVGASGSGKRTLLNLLGGLDQPDSGQVLLNGQGFSSLSDNQRGLLRNQYMGFVYQFHHLLPEFSAIENVAMPHLIAGETRDLANRKAKALLDQVGLSHRGHHKPMELSGGERQRVAIARALTNQPSCVLMDEPTGNLDRGNAEAILQLMMQLSEDLATSFVVVTHDEMLAARMDIVYELCDGVLSAATAQADK